MAAGLAARVDAVVEATTVEELLVTDGARLESGELVAGGTDARDDPTSCPVHPATSKMPATNDHRNTVVLICLASSRSEGLDGPNGDRVAQSSGNPDKALQSTGPLMIDHAPWQPP